MQASQQVYEDAQYQSSDPIGYQPPIPAGIHENIELSWDRKRGYMRIIIDGKTWHFKEYLGKAEVTGTDNKRGRIYLRAMARIDGETLTTYRDPLASHPVVEGERRESTHNRLCYRRQSQEWRLRDERLPWNHPEALKFTQSYVGLLSAEWHMADSVAHIYHNGYVIIDKDDVAHLYDTEL